MGKYIKNIDDIENRLEAEQVIEAIGHLYQNKTQRNGKEIRVPCPVHKGDGCNLAINTSTHQWFCHSRGCKGSRLIDLYAESTDTNFRDAAEQLAGRFNIPIQYKEETFQYTPNDVIKSWQEAKESGDDVYFSNKKLSPPPGIKFGKNPSGYYGLLVPLKDIEGYLKGILSLSPGGKFNFKIDDIVGAFFLFGNIAQAEEVIIGEGIATVQTAWESYERKIPAVSCGTWSNIEPVTAAIKLKYPRLKPIILIDCDKDGNGEKAAHLVAQKFPDAEFRKPSFESFPNPNNEKLTDFNDIVSQCGQSLDEVKRQLEIGYILSKKEIIENPLDTSSNEEDFYSRLGKCINNPRYVHQLKNRTYDNFETEHKNLFASGGLITGYEKIDEQLYFSIGDFIIAQAMSNHGKTTLMLQLGYRFLTKEENKEKEPMCIFFTYESTPLRIEEKFINIIGNECEEGTALLYSRSSKDKYLYPDKAGYRKTISIYNQLQSENRLHILKGIPLEKLGLLIDIYKAEYPSRTLVLFLDYLQILDTSSKKDGWEKIKYIAYELEKLAIEKEVIIFSACQVNDNRQTREGRDIYNAATTVIDIFNHSHASLETNENLKKEYKKHINGKSVCTFSVIKQKHGSSFIIPDCFLFNGHNFTLNDKKEFQGYPKPPIGHTINNY